jgi:hypothetical protein
MSFSKFTTPNSIPTLADAWADAKKIRDHRKPKIAAPVELTQRPAPLQKHEPAQEDTDDNIGNRVDERREYQELPDGFSIVNDYPQFRQLVANFRKLKCEAHANMDIEGTPKSFPRLAHLEVCYRGYYFIQVRSLPLNLLRGAI